MTSRDRGLIKPRRGSEPGHYTTVAKESSYLVGTNGVFKPASNFPELLTVTKPLLDRTNTPRSASK